MFDTLEAGKNQYKRYGLIDLIAKCTVTIICDFCDDYFDDA